MLARRVLLLAGVAVFLNCASTKPPDSPPMVDVRGVIRDRDGIGVEGVRVFLDPADDDRQVGRAVPTDKSGAFHTRIRPGPYAVQIMAFLARVPAVTLDTIRLSPPSRTLDYQYGGLKIQGRLLGPEGSPLRSGCLTAHGRYPGGYDVNLQTRVTGGRYVFFGPPSEYYLTYSPSPDYYFEPPSGPLPTIGGRTISVRADTTIDLSVDGHPISVKVILDGHGFDGAEVSAAGMTESRLDVSARETTRRDGTFRVYLPSGEYGFQVRPGKAHANVVFRAFSRRITGPQAITLDMSGTVWRGTVIDSITGSPIPSVRVMATDTRLRSLFATSVSDWNGHFRLVLETGLTYVLSISSERMSAPKTLPAVRAGRDSTFDLRIDSSGRSVRTHR